MELTGTNTLRNNVRDLLNVRNPRERDRTGLLERTPGVFTVKQNQMEASNQILMIFSCNQLSASGLCHSMLKTIYSATGCIRKGLQLENTR